MKKFLPIFLTAIVCLTLSVGTVSVFAFAHANGLAFTPPDDTSPSPAETFDNAIVEAVTEAVIETPIEAPEELKVIFLAPDGRMQTITTLPGLIDLPPSNFTEEGKIFKGWRLDGDESLYSEGDQILVTEDLAITAIFGKIPRTVKLCNGDSVEEITCEDDQFTLPAAAPDEEGFIFAGWSIKADGPVVWRAGETIDVSANISLHAIFELRAYTVSFLAGEGSGSADPLTCRHGERIELVNSGFSRSKYVMSGYQDEDGNFYNIGNSITVTKDMQLSATWKLRNKVTLTIDDRIDRSGALYSIKIRDYLDIDALATSGCTGFRVIIKQTSTPSDNNKCEPRLDIYSAAPQNNRNVFVYDNAFAVATYSSENRVFSKSFSTSSQDAFSTANIGLDQLLQSNELCIHYQALPSFYADFSNAYNISCEVTIEVF